MKRKRQTKPDPDFVFVPPDKAVAFEAVEWQFAFTYAVEVSHSPATVLNNPTDYKIRIKDERKTYVFNDIPMNRLGVAMCQRFKNDKPKYYSFMWRWLAFIDLVNSNLLGDDLHRRARSEDEPDEIHPCVVELTGRFPINKEGKFEHAAFMKELCKMITDSDRASD